MPADPTVVWMAAFAHPARCRIAPSAGAASHLTHNVPGMQALVAQQAAKDGKALPEVTALAKLRTDAAVIPTQNGNQLVRASGCPRPPPPSIASPSLAAILPPLPCNHQIALVIQGNDGRLMLPNRKWCGTSSFQSEPSPWRVPSPSTLTTSPSTPARPAYWDTRRC